MQKYTPFTDDLQIAFGRCQARFKCAVAVVLVIALCAVCVTLWQIGRAKPLVLEESTKELLLKEASVDRKLKAWCDDVEAFADNIARQSLVQLSVSSYAAMSKEERSALNQKEIGIRYAAAKQITVDFWVTEIVSGKKNEKEHESQRGSQERS